MAEVSERLMGFGETRTRACRVRKDVGVDMSSRFSQLEMIRLNCRGAQIAVVRSLAVLRSVHHELHHNANATQHTTHQWQCLRSRINCSADCGCTCSSKSLALPLGDGRPS